MTESPSFINFLNRNLCTTPGRQKPIQKSPFNNRSLDNQNKIHWTKSHDKVNETETLRTFTPDIAQTSAVDHIHWRQ